MGSTTVVQVIQTVTAELDSIAQALQSVQSIPAGLDTVTQAVRHVQVVATELDSIAQTLRASPPWQTYLLPGCQVATAVLMFPVTFCSQILKTSR